MTPLAPDQKHESALHRKAMEIFTLARNVSAYIVQDLAQLEPNGTENPNIYFTGDIVQQSVSLAPEILKAESQAFAEGKFKSAAAVTRLTNMLYKNCERLERVDSNGKDFLPLLRSEIKKFRKLQRIWMLTL